MTRYTIRHADGARRTGVLTAESSQATPPARWSPPQLAARGPGRPPVLVRPADGGRPLVTIIRADRG